MTQKTKKTSWMASAAGWDKRLHKQVRRRLGLSKYQYLTLTFAKGIAVGYLLALLFNH